MGTTLLEDPGSDPSRKAKTTLVDHNAGKTRLVAPIRQSDGADTTTSSGSSTSSSDPVVGWLVVVAGPGRGTAVTLGHGMNSVGRGSSNRVVLDFGDDKISSDDHFRVAYDQESREFHLVPGKGTNLLYVADKVVLAPSSLEAMTDIRVGATTLRFVPFCNQAWDWTDTAG